MPRACAFCSRPASAEHALSQWLVDVLHDSFASPAYDLVYQTRGLQEQDRHREVYDPAVKVRAACRACNQTWMSALEAEAKKLLLPAIVDADFPSLDATSRRKVAAWAVLKTMMFEHLSPLTRVASDAHYQALYNYSVPPKGYSIRLGTCDSNLVVWTMRVIAEVQTPEGLRSRAVCFTLVVGHLVVQTLFDPFDGQRHDPLMRAIAGTAVIHPPAASSARRLVMRLDDTAIHELAHDPFRDAPDPSPYFDPVGAIRPPDSEAERTMLPKKGPADAAQSS